MKGGNYLGCLVNVFLVCLIANVGTAAIKDAESATHGTDASQYQIVDTYKFTGYELVQINLPVLSHYSYMLISDGKTLIVDPGRDVQFYADLVNEKSLSVSGIFLTHSHADFVAGHMELVRLFDCPIYQSVKSGAKYKIEPVKDGTTLQFGKSFIKFIDTPGHVLDGTSATVGPNKDSPELILTGDFLFVGGVGRPDLVAGTTSSALAGMLFDTWADKISKLPDDVKVFPAHGAGSLCGAHLKDQPFSTIGEERNFKAKCVQAGIKTNLKLNLHGLRKSWAMNLASSGKVPMKTLQELGGWSDMKTCEEFYLRSSDANRQRACDVLNELAGGEE